MSVAEAIVVAGGVTVSLADNITSIAGGKDAEDAIWRISDIYAVLVRAVVDNDELVV